MKFKHRVRIAFILFLALHSFGAAQDRHKVTFGVIADCQYADANPSGTRFYRNSLAKLREALEVMRAEKVEFILHLGDVIDRDFRSYDSVLAVWKQASAPVHFVLGNHEYSVDSVLKPRVIEKLSMKKDYYAFDAGNWIFVALNGNDLAPRFPRDEEAKREGDSLLALITTKKEINIGKWNGGIGRRQRAWLDSILTAADKSGRPVLVCCHFPLVPHKEHNLWNDREIVALLESHISVKGYLCGHNHDGGHKKKEGIHHINFHGMVETEDTNAFAIVRLGKKKMKIDGHGREPSRELRYR